MSKNNKTPDFIMTRREMVVWFNERFPEGKIINRHTRDENHKIIGTKVVRNPFNSMDIAEFSRKGFSPKKYSPCLVIIPYKMSYDTIGVIKKEEKFAIFLNK